MSAELTEKVASNADMDEFAKSFKNLKGAFI